jgi:hypothetical protein
MVKTKAVSCKKYQEGSNLKIVIKKVQMKAVLFKKCQEGSDLLCETSKRKQSHWTTKAEAE